jgi:hypothetical protein
MPRRSPKGGALANQDLTTDFATLEAADDRGGGRGSVYGRIQEIYGLICHAENFYKCVSVSDSLTKMFALGFSQICKNAGFVGQYAG